MRTAIIAFLAAAMQVVAADSDSPDIIEKLADAPSRVVIYSLKPEHDPEIPPHETFHRFPIRGHADIADPNERRALVRALARGVRDANPNVQGACFNPRHGLRFEQGIYAADFVICFECLQVEAYGFQPSDFFLTTEAPQQTFDESLRRHNLPLPEK